MSDDHTSRFRDTSAPTPLERLAALEEIVRDQARALREHGAWLDDLEAAFTGLLTAVAAAAQAEAEPAPDDAA